MSTYFSRENPQDLNRYYSPDILIVGGGMAGISGSQRQKTENRKNREQMEPSALRLDFFQHESSNSCRSFNGKNPYPDPWL